MLARILRALALRRRRYTPRDVDGRFVSADHQRAIEAAKTLRAEVESKNPEKKWKHSLG